MFRDAGEIVRVNGLGSRRCSRLSQHLHWLDQLGRSRIWPDQPPSSSTRWGDSIVRWGPFSTISTARWQGRLCRRNQRRPRSADPPEDRCIHRVTNAEIEALLDRVEAIAKAHSGDLPSLRAKIVADLRGSPFIGGVYSDDILAHAPATDWKAQLMKRSFRPAISRTFPCGRTSRACSILRGTAYSLLQGGHDLRRGEIGPRLALCLRPAGAGDLLRRRRAAPARWPRGRERLTWRPRWRRWQVSPLRAVSTAMHCLVALDRAACRKFGERTSTDE